MTERLQPVGVHHLAFMAADMKKHIEFFTQVVGFPLTAIFDMHGVPGATHCFMKMSDHEYFSIVLLPDVDKIPVEIGVTHAGYGEGPSAKGTLQHMAFRVHSEEALLGMRDRIRSHGINVIGPVDHGFCKSIYFAGPDDTALEVAWGREAIDPKVWIDPQSLERIGIDPADMDRYVNPPATYTGPSPVPQPDYDPDKPHLHFPDPLYRKLLAKSDESIGRSGDWALPPAEARAAFEAKAAAKAAAGA